MTVIDEKEDLLARMVEVQERTGGSVVASDGGSPRGYFRLRVQAAIEAVEARTVSSRSPVWLRSPLLMRLPRTTL